ncbi:MAG: hypothetical protein WCD81_10380 [Candidatus Bathyarchaeia archaeon]
MAKLKLWKTLAEETFKWIENQKKLKRPGRREEESETEEGRRKQHWYKIRETAKAEILDLKRLADILPEDQLQQIFNEKNLCSPDEKGRPSLFQVLFSFSEEHGVHVGTWVEDKVVKGEQNKISLTADALKRRVRILELSRAIIEMLDGDIPNLSGPLAPAFHDVTLREGGALPHLRAIYYASLRQAQEEGLAQARKSSKEAPASRERI